MKITELNEQTAKLKPVIKPITAVKPVRATESGPPQKPAPLAKPHHTAKPPKKILSKAFPENAPTGCPGLDDILHSLRNGLPPQKEREKRRKETTPKTRTS